MGARALTAKRARGSGDQHETAMVRARLRAIGAADSCMAASVGAAAVVASGES